VSLGTVTRARRGLLWLDERLGNPMRGDGPFTFRRAVALDESEEFPAEAASELDRLGLPRYYVPVSLGGELRGFDELASLLRAVARYDLTVAIGHGKTLLGTQPIFIADDDSLKVRVAGRVLAGEAIALALTERENGSDLLATATAAVGQAPTRISGEKWLINNARRCTGLSVLARTRPTGGPRGFSLLWVNKGEAEGAFDLLPKSRTHGIRGADISGIRFRDAPCSASPIGGEGGGLEVVLRTFMVTRTLVASAAVGAGESALRIAVIFARSRTLYGRTVLDIPHAHDALCSAGAAVLACEAIALAGARILHAAPEQALFWSAVLKFYIPVTIEAVVRELAVVLGARHYLRDDHAAGMFQKIVRDVAILSVFDGSTMVNLSTVARHLAAALATPSVASLGASAALGEPLPAFDPGRLSLVTRSLTGPAALVRKSLAHSRELPSAEAVRPLLERLLARIEHLRAAEGVVALRSAFDMTSGATAAAADCARLAAAALAAAVWSESCETSRGVRPSGDWLAVFLARELGETEPALALDACRVSVLTSLLRAAESGSPFSLCEDGTTRRAS
jgi:alkylation response protein AidB-like acyl-CoA dehydrogenase